MSGISSKKVAIIGGGPAGIKAASILAGMGINVVLFERQAKPGGHLAQWHKLFPLNKDASLVLDPLLSELSSDMIEVKNGVAVTEIRKNDSCWEVITNSENPIKADAVLIATGFDTFDAKLKEEYGYGIYPAVLTSEELERAFYKTQDYPFDKSKKDLKIGMIHCVGSRDTKCGNNFCSKVCCITAVKQAIELKKEFPDAKIYCFYMDMRMFGLGYEELYHEAQTEYGIQFIRGRLSEASPDKNDTVQIKAEDTLLGRPLKMTLDMLVLMVGMAPSHKITVEDNSVKFEKPSFGESFIEPLDRFLYPNSSKAEGIFFAGACKCPDSIPDVFKDANSAALEISNYLKKI